jgi:proton-coupled amino acid transporter
MAEMRHSHALLLGGDREQQPEQEQQQQQQQQQQQEEEADHLDAVAAYDGDGDGGEKRGGSGARAEPMEEGVHMFATLLKMFIGSGVLFLPRAFANGGWLFSCVAMAFCALVTGVCILRLVECRQAVKGSYGFLGQRAAGIWGRRAVDVSVVLSQAGFCCVYIVFIARNALQLLNTGRCWLGGEWLWLLILLEWPLFTPLTWIRNLASFGPTNVAADVFIMGGLAGVLAWCAQGFATAPAGGAPLAVPAFAADTFALTLGTAVYAFEGVGMVVPVYEALSPRAQARFPYTMSATVAFIAALYITVGLVPYLFVQGVLHEKVADAVTLNLPRVWWSYGIQAGFCAALTFSYPLMMHPAMQIMERAAAPYIFVLRKGGKGLGEAAASPLADNDDGGVDGGSDGGSDGSGACGGLSNQARSNAFRGMVVAVSLLVAFAGSTQLDNFVSLIGCFCCTPLAFIYPCYFHLRLCKPTGFAYWTDWAIIVFGIGVFFFSTYEAIVGWSVTTINPCV